MTEYCDRGISIQYMKIFILGVFFEAYTKWIRLKTFYNQQQLRQSESGTQCTYPSLPLTTEGEPPHEHYLCILLEALAEYILFVLGVMLAVNLLKNKISPPSPGNDYVFIKYNYVAMAVILSSFGKVFAFLTMIWDYDHTPSFVTIVDIFVWTSNILALQVFLATTFMKASSVVFVGLAMRVFFQVLLCGNLEGCCSYSCHFCN